jgi:predicted DNA-binding transcriptional regulator AlpA
VPDEVYEKGSEPNQWSGWFFHEFFGGFVPIPLQGPSQETCTPLSQPEPRQVLEGYIRSQELADQLGLSPRTIHRWEALRKGPPRVCVGRTILYRVDSVREWLLSIEQATLSTRKRRRFLGVKP